MQKDNKKVFKKTNKRQELLHGQLMYKRIPSDIQGESENNQPKFIAECPGDCKCHKDSVLLAIERTDHIISTTSTYDYQQNALIHLQIKSGQAIWTRSNY